MSNKNRSTSLQIDVAPALADALKSEILLVGHEEHWKCDLCQAEARSADELEHKDSCPLSASIDRAAIMRVIEKETGLTPEAVNRAFLTIDEAYSKLVDNDRDGRWRCGLCHLGWHKEMDDIVHAPDCFAGRILDAANILHKLTTLGNEGE
jgi:hypothetical protein